MTRLLAWIAVAAALAGVVFWLLPHDGPSPVSVERWDASDPWLIGDLDDAYDYAGETAYPLEGAHAELWIDPTTGDGALDVTLPADARVSHLLDGVQTPSRTTFRQRFANGVTVWTDETIHGNTGIGDVALPETPATLAGKGPIDLSISGTPLTGWEAFWAVGDALRRNDGAIRNQGLVFSPLLRDRSGFSDPARTELTILLYAAEDPEVLVLELVFAEPVPTQTLP